MSSGQARAQEKHIIDSFIKSAFASDNRFQSLNETISWLRALQNDPKYKVEQIGLKDLNGWFFEDDTLNIRHQSGKFFSIEGLDCTPSHPGSFPWQQPIIHQREVGILGIITREFEGTRYLLMQAKMEPGNINKVQLSPTLQATYSNYTQTHKGRTPPYLEYFLDENANVISNQLQSETGTRFFQKNNSNILLDVKDDIEVQPGFCWLTLGEIQSLMLMDEVINMDSRTVLSNIYFGQAESLDNSGQNEFLRSMQCVTSHTYKPFDDLATWLHSTREKYPITTKDIALSSVKDWIVDEWSVRHKDNHFFSVAGVAVEASDREVTSWSQPLLKHEGLGLAGFLCTNINGVLHFLIQAKPEPGIVGSLELGPTVSISDYLNRAQQPDAAPFFEYFINPPKETLIHTSIQPEEGGRFWNLRNQYLVIEVPDKDILEGHDRYQWMTLGQLHKFSQGTNLVNSEGRTLLACLKFDNINN